MALNTVSFTRKFSSDEKFSKIFKHLYYPNLSIEYNLKRNYRNYAKVFANIDIKTKSNTKKKSFPSFRTMKNVSSYNYLIRQGMPHTKYSTKSAKLNETVSTPGRHQFHKETEEAINEQITIEYQAAFAYLSMACYFGTTDIALPGCQGFFINMFEEELEHAMYFIKYQLFRGARVKLSSIKMPDSQDWKCITKAFTASLELEKVVKEKLVCLSSIAEKHGDLELMDIIAAQFMDEQNRSICELARLLTRAKMASDPVGEYLFDTWLYNSFVKKSKVKLAYRKELDGAADEDEVYK